MHASIIYQPLPTVKSEGELSSEHEFRISNNVHLIRCSSIISVAPHLITRAYTVSTIYTITRQEGKINVQLKVTFDPLTSAHPL